MLDTKSQDIHRRLRDIILRLRLKYSVPENKGEQLKLLVIP